MRSDRFGKPTPTLRHDRGFTLIELMIAVAIIGILVSIAIPSYQRYVDDTRRSEGRQVLLSTAQLLERCYTTHGSYDDGDCDAGLPRDSENDFYRISAPDDDGVEIDANSFTLVAAPQGAHSGDDCGSLTLEHTGAKGVDGAGNGMTRDTCW